MTMTEGVEYKIQSYEDFWPIYLREHLDDTCRNLHYVGTSWAILCLTMLAITFNGLWFVAGLIGAYGMAWFGHFKFEKNQPATFKYPLWSLISDWRMFGRFITGKLNDDLERVRNLPALKDIKS